jgi:hypothetical protein
MGTSSGPGRFALTGVSVLEGFRVSPVDEEFLRAWPKREQNRGSIRVVIRTLGYGTSVAADHPDEVSSV